MRISSRVYVSFFSLFSEPLCTGVWCCWVRCPWELKFEVVFVLNFLTRQVITQPCSIPCPNHHLWPTTRHQFSLYSLHPWSYMMIIIYAENTATETLTCKQGEVNVITISALGTYATANKNNTELYFVIYWQVVSKLCIQYNKHFNRKTVNNNRFCLEIKMKTVKARQMITYIALSTKYRLYVTIAATWLYVIEVFIRSCLQLYISIMTQQKSDIRVIRFGDL